MSYIDINEETCKAAVLGGAFLGGGGGGPKEKGLEMANLSIKSGNPIIKPVDDINEGKVVTVSAVGAPAAKEKHIKPSHYVRAVDILRKRFKINVTGLISSEIGGLGITNGMFQSSILNIPIIDAPADGRAHPTGVMGSMGLDEIENYESIQALCGGDPKKDKYIESTFEGDLEEVSKFVRQASSQIGGLVAVARNPISVEYVKKNAALGAIKQAIELGKNIVDEKSEGIKKIVKKLEGKIITEGKITKKKLETKGGFDIGKVEISDKIKLTFWNEYMTLEEENERLATFPDLIFVTNSNTGIPLTTAEIKKGDNVIVGFIPLQNILLGKGVKSRKNLKEIENVIEKDILNFIPKSYFPR